MDGEYNNYKSSSLMKFQPLEHKKERFRSILWAFIISGLLSLVTFVPILVVIFHQNLVRPFPVNLSSGSEDVSHIINNNFIKCYPGN